MTATRAISDGFRAPDPVHQILARIESGRARLRRERSAPQVYTLFEDGRFLGAIRAPEGTPEFGKAAPTVLLERR
jgi:hypothetical protein